MGEANTVLHIVALINVIVICIKYYVTKKVPNYETKIYGYLLMAILVENFTVLTLFIAMAQMPPLMMNIIHGFYLSSLIAWMLFFSLYISKVAEENEKVFNTTEKLLIVTAIISAFLAMILPRNISPDDINETAASGPAIAVTALYSVFCFLIIIINILRNRKKLFDKKFIPLFVLLTTSLMFFGGQGVLTKMFPQLFLFTPIEGYIVFIMYFTIENPDVKMLLQVENARDIAEKANRAKSDFLSSMSHEIRTPLNAIVGLTEDNLQYQENCPKEVNENSKDIMSASQTLLEIVGNILDINKIEANKMEIVDAPYNLAEEITNMCKITQTRIDDKPITFSLNLSDNIPYELIGDKSKIKEIVNNFITNAIKYTDEGTINLNIRCKNNLEKNISDLIISCQDSGKGIKKENIDKLFSKFERLDVEQNSTIEGTGLGLAITQELVNMMNGKIDVVSEEGKGSIFTVIIPQQISKLYKPEELEKQREAANRNQTITLHTAEQPKETEKVEELETNEETTKTESNDKKLKLLIVDDNKLNIKVARRAIEHLNFEIDECYDGSECIEKIRGGNEYNIILMDIMMPGTDGEKTIQALKQDPNFNIPTIAVTADAVAGAKEKYLGEGFSDYIAKPFRKEEITEKINGLLNGNPPKEMEV